MNLQALAQLVPPLHGCTLCAHSMERDGVREVFGVQPVNVIRASSEACGPSASHMHMHTWGALA